MCVDMEGTLLTVEETVEVAPVVTPTPRRRAPRPRAAAKPAPESSEVGVAEQEAVATGEIAPDRLPAQEEVAPESSQEAIALGEPETVIAVEPTQVPEVQVSDAAGEEAAEVGATAWV